MGKKEVKELLESQLKSNKTERISSWILLVIGILTVWLIVGILFIILALVGLHSTGKKIDEINLKLAEL